MIKVAFACGPNGEFGLGDAFPWGDKPFKEDMKVFKEFTDGCILVMGRKTFESLPCKLRGLRHVVLSNSDTEIRCKNGSAPCVVTSQRYHLKLYLQTVSSVNGTPVCVIGGAGLIDSVVKYADAIMMTEVFHEDDMDSDVCLSDETQHYLVSKLLKHPNNIEMFRDGGSEYDYCITVM